MTFHEIKLDATGNPLYELDMVEFNGKWYTDVRPFRFDIEAPQQNQPMQQPIQNQQFAPQSYEQPVNNTPVTAYFETDNGDDLPF